MKKYLFIASCFFCLSATSVYAQVDKEAAKAEKAARSEADKMVKKARQTYEFSIPNPQYGRKETDYAKLEGAHTMIQEALSNKYAKENPETYRAAFDIEYLYFQQAENAIKAGDESARAAYIDAAQKCVQYAVKFDEMAKNDPKQKEYPKHHTYYQQQAANPVLQCLQAAQGGGTGEEPTVEDYKRQVALAALVYSAFEESSLFKDFPQKGSDSYNDWILYAKVFRAQPLLQIPGTSDAEIDAAFRALIGTKFTENAYLQLAGYYREKDQAKYESLLKEGMEALPQNHAFPMNLFNLYFTEKKYEEAKAVARQVIEKFPEDAADMHYKIGIICFNAEDLQGALDSFKAAYAISNDVDHLKNAAIAAAQITIKNDSKDKAVIAQLNNQAIELLEQYSKAAPDDTELWGPRLYALYNNTGNAAKAAQYKKYYK